MLTILIFVYLMIGSNIIIISTLPREDYKEEEEKASTTLEKGVGLLLIFLFWPIALLYYIYKGIF